MEKYMICLILILMIVVLAYLYISKCDTCNALLKKLFKKDKEIFDYQTKDK